MKSTSGVSRARVFATADGVGRSGKGRDGREDTRATGSQEDASGTRAMTLGSWVRSLAPRLAIRPHVDPADVFSAVAAAHGRKHHEWSAAGGATRGQGSVARGIDREVGAHPSRSSARPRLCLPVTGGQAPPRFEARPRASQE
jgi:hypothetical protein